MMRRVARASLAAALPRKAAVCAASGHAAAAAAATVPLLATPQQQRRSYWKIGENDEYFQALLSLDADGIVHTLQRNGPEDSTHMLRAMHALWALAKVDDEQRGLLQENTEVRDTVRKVMDRAVDTKDLELCEITCEYLQMAGEYSPEHPAVVAAAAAFPDSSIVAGTQDS